MDFATYKTTVEELNARMKRASQRMRELGAGTGQRGLTPDHVKFSPEYRLARREYQTAFSALRDLNQKHLKSFRKELQAERVATLARTA